MYICPFYIYGLIDAYGLGLPHRGGVPAGPGAPAGRRGHRGLARDQRRRRRGLLLRPRQGVDAQGGALRAAGGEGDIILSYILSDRRRQLDMSMK